jgi:integrase
MVTGDLVQHLGGLTIEATKTKHSRRRIDLPEDAIVALRDRLKLCFGEGGSQLVFTTATGKPVHDDSLRHRWWKPLLLKAAEIAEKAARESGDPTYRFPTKLRLYDLRHTAKYLRKCQACGYPMVAGQGRGRPRKFHEWCKDAADQRKHRGTPILKRPVAMELPPFVLPGRSGNPVSAPNRRGAQARFRADYGENEN